MKTESGGLGSRTTAPKYDVILAALDLGLQAWRTTASRDRFIDAVAELGHARVAYDKEHAARVRAEEALRKLADEEAWSMRNEDVERYGMRHGPWYFDPETDDGDEPPWKIAQDALIDDFSDDPQAHLQGHGAVGGNTP